MVKLDKVDEETMGRDLGHGQRAPDDPNLSPRYEDGGGIQYFRACSVSERGRIVNLGCFILG